MIPSQSIYVDPQSQGKQEEVKPLKHPKIKGMLENACHVASDILGERSSGGSRSVHVHHHSYSPWCWWLFPMYQPIVIDNRSRVERSRSDRAFWGVVFGIIGLGVSYFIVKDIEKIQRANGELHRLHLEKNVESWRCKEAQDSQSSDMVKIRGVLNGERNIFQRMRKEAMWGLALKVSLLAAAVIGVVGAVVAMPELMALGGLGIFISGCAMLIHYGMQSTDKRNEQEAKWILETAKPLLARKG